MWSTNPSLKQDSSLRAPLETKLMRIRVHSTHAATSQRKLASPGVEMSRQRSGLRLELVVRDNGLGKRRN